MATKKLSLNHQFFFNAADLVEYSDFIRKEWKFNVNKLLRICEDVENGVFTHYRGTTKEYQVEYRYSKDNKEYAQLIINKLARKSRNKRVTK